MKALIALSVLLVALSSVQFSCAQYNRTAFREIVIDDNTNDDAIGLTALELITRSGYRYEVYYVAARDGYISQIVRLINPLADLARLIRPPLLIFHGANIDMTCYMIASGIQHHPEPFPRTPEDGPITSSNRSLAFTLVNNGYDVYLIGSRGSNRANTAYTTDQAIIDRINSGDYSPLQDESLYSFSKTSRYWLFGLDDIIAYDIKLYIDKVRDLTNSQELSIFSYSLSTPTTLAFLAANPDYAQSIRTYFQMGPAITADHFTFFDTLYFEKLCPLFPTRGIGFTPTFTVKPLVRNLVTALSASAEIRYTLIYEVIVQIFGPSPIFQTNLERNLLNHVFMPVSFKSVQHYCQNSVSKRMTKFDYRTAGNLQRYNQTEPPEYDISDLQVQNWVIVSGTNDGLADPATVERLKRQVNTPKPPVEIVGPLFNHVDLIGAVQNDIFINLPILDQLNRNSDVQT